mgnify:FL=1
MFGSPIFLWLALFVVFLIVEAGTVALVSIWFALGALAALAACVLGAEMWLQITVFLVVSLVLLAVLWKRVRNKLTTTKTNVDSVIGAEGYVTEAIDNLSYTGRVKLGGITWAARSTSGAGIPVGTLVKVERIEGVKVFVSPAEVACKQ